MIFQLLRFKWILYIVDIVNICRVTECRYIK